jgi:hypothetical protein
LKGKIYDNISLIQCNEQINRETRIIGKCCNCDNIYNKCFRELIKIKRYCIQCSKDIGIEKKNKQILVYLVSHTLLKMTKLNKKQVIILIKSGEHIHLKSKKQKIK